MMKQSDVENRFLHPALQHNKLYTVMVHKSQESLAREVLSAYPWFAGKHEHEGVAIKAVREVSFEIVFVGSVLVVDAVGAFYLGKSGIRSGSRWTGGRSAPSGLGREIRGIDRYPVEIRVRVFCPELRRRLPTLPNTAYGLSLTGPCQFTYG